MNSSADDHGTSNENTSPRRKRLSPALLTLLIIGSILLPVVFWQGTWFGTRLTDEKIAEYLQARDNPRRVQHALVQLTDRLERGDPAMRQLYPHVIALVDHPREEVRSTLAWALGWDPQSEEFHEALRTLLLDGEPLVRRNAALALSKFGDASCRPQLRAMLEPYAVPAPFAGKVSDLPPKGRTVKAHTTLATITDAADITRKLHAPLDGHVHAIEHGNSSHVAAGDTICHLSPGENDMREALRALAVIGAPSDAEAIRSALHRNYTSPRAAEQGELTLKIIEKRSAQNGGG
jgi:biotin carboxyl carrier protein